MIFLITFFASWTIWFISADKQRWRELFAVSLLSVCLAFLTDALMHHHKLWAYYDPLLPEPCIEMTFGFGVYTVVPYLFIQWLPKPPSLLRLALYWLGWTGLTIAVEKFYVVSGHMVHQQWWTLAHSYAADWVIFWLLYQYHRVFRLARLSAPGPPGRR